MTYWRKAIQTFKAHKSIFTYKFTDTHLAFHSGEQPFLYKMCGKGFAYRSYVTKHMPLHNGENKCMCKECGKEFPHISKLNQHMPSYTGNNAFLCQVCNVAFKKKITRKNTFVELCLQNKLPSRDTWAPIFVRNHAGGKNVAQSSLITFSLRDIYAHPK